MELPLREFIEVIRDIGQKVRWCASGTKCHTVLAIAKLTCPKPHRAVFLIHHAVAVQRIERFLHQTVFIKFLFGIPYVKFYFQNFLNGFFIIFLNFLRGKISNSISTHLTECCILFLQPHLDAVGIRPRVRLTPPQNRLSQFLNLSACFCIVNIILASYFASGKRQNICEHIAQKRSAAVTDCQRTRRVCGNKFNVNS